MEGRSVFFVWNQQYAHLCTHVYPFVHVYSGTYSYIYNKTLGTMKITLLYQVSHLSG